MIKQYLTCERYLRHYKDGEKSAVIPLNGTENLYVVERPNDHDLYFDNTTVRILRPEEHYFVGPVADTLHAYEELGYTPEELKKIIEEHKELKRRVLHISTAASSVYGTFGSPFEKKFREMREDLERRAVIYAKFDTDYAIESLYPRIMPTKTAYDIIKELVGKFENKPTLKHLEIEAWAKAQTTSSKPKHPIVERAIFNDPATIVFWKDGTKTVVKAQKGETYDPEKGLAMAFSKKMFGNEGNYYDQFTKLLPKKNAKK